jgi:hypothetical protein
MASGGQHKTDVGWPIPVADGRRSPDLYRQVRDLYPRPVGVAAGREDGSLGRFDDGVDLRCEYSRSASPVIETDEP